VALSLSPGNPMRNVLLTVLVFELIVFGLSVPVMILVSDVPSLTAGLLGGGAALLALVSAGLLRRSVGYPLGWATQLVGVGLGFATPGMFVVGVLFGGLWVLSFILGRRLDAMGRSAPAGPDRV